MKVINYSKYILMIYNEYISLINIRFISFCTGFLEFFNKTTLQWIPLCDTRFTERNAQVVCRQLGYDSLNVYVSYDRRYELHPGSLIRVWSWPEPLQVNKSILFKKKIIELFSTSVLPSFFSSFFNVLHTLVYWKRGETGRLSDQTKRPIIRTPTRMLVGQSVRFHKLWKT